MSQFQKSYKDTIRNLKLEQKERTPADTHIPVYKINKLFQTYTLNIDDTNINNEFIKLNEYQRNASDIVDFSIPREKDYYEDIIKYLPSLIDEQFVDNDYLTGLYFNKMLNLKNISCFIAGFNKDSLHRGLSYNNKIKYYGCDKVYNYSNKKLYINGVARKCDVHDINSVRSINLQMGEVIPVKSLDLYICDIKAVTDQSLLCSYLIQQSFMKLKSTIILRLPETMYLNTLHHILLFFTSHYAYISIFKTPWGKIPKHYIILKDQKREIENVKYNKLITYAKNKIDYIYKIDCLYKLDEINIKKLSENILKLTEYDLFNPEDIQTACLELIE